MYNNDRVIKNITEDKLFRTAEVENLAKIIQDVPSPFVVSINGDWGTGKTSFVNMVEQNINKDNKNINFINIDIWDYSKFMIEKKVVYNFISEIAGRVIIENKYLKKIKKSLENIESIELGSEKYGKMILRKKSIDLHTEVRSIKSNLKKALDKKSEKIFIFVDNLDRVSPELSVEILEIIHLILELPNCVFILAIDYEVIIKGYHKKMGGDMSMQKAKDYFDKIIQLSIDLPSLSYENEKKFIESRIKESILEEEIQRELSNETSYNILKIGTNTNPRKISRILNYLNYSISKVKNKQNIDYTILLCFVCLKHEYQSIYQLYREALLEKSQLLSIKTTELFEIFSTSDELDPKHEYSEVQKKINKIIETYSLEKNLPSIEIMNNIDILLNVIHKNSQEEDLFQIIVLIEDAMYESDSAKILKNNANIAELPEKLDNQTMGKYVMSTIEKASLTKKEIEEMTTREFARNHFQTSTPVFRDITNVDEKEYGEERFKVLDKRTKYARYYKNPIKLKVKNEDRELILLLSSQWGDYQYGTYYKWLSDHI